MSIDLDSAEGRKKYLSDKLDDLLEGINDSYGVLLMEELLARLELTVKDFNDEMKTLCENLVTKEKERQQLLEMLKSSDGIPAPTIGQNDSNLDMDSSTSNLNDDIAIEELDVDAPEWERKLAKLEKK